MNVRVIVRPDGTPLTGNRDHARLRAPGERTFAGSVKSTACRVLSGQVHGYHWWTVADVPVDGRRVVLRVRVRRSVCPTRGCRQTFREQVPGVLERCQLRTPRLARQAKAGAKELAGRAGVRLLAALAIGLSRHTALRVLLGIPLPDGRVPRVVGVDHFALRRRHRYATVVIDAETHRRIDVLPDRTSDTLEAWLRAHPGVEVVCRDGSTTYAEGIRRALPDAVQVSDRWHRWNNLCEAALDEVKAHSTCWATVLDTPIHDGPRAQTTLERWHQIHGLLDQGMGLLECLAACNWFLDALTAVCPEMTHLATAIRAFAPLMTPQPENADALHQWISQVRSADLPHLHAITRGLERDRDAVIAAVTPPYSYGPTEGVSTKTKRMAHQIHGRAGFTLLRQHHPALPPDVRQIQVNGGSAVVRGPAAGG
ncbi:ISL3 family transposase [Streptomyces sp. IBSNAI002]|uniref:ISL3 family transposase n=1 Tax=Streptomyces sp. IBSNAI002 TaxID=3457500 RepID=UPI003FCFBC0C